MNRKDAIMRIQQENGLWNVYEINGLYAENVCEVQACMYMRGLREEAELLEKKEFQNDNRD